MVHRLSPLLACALAGLLPATAWGQASRLAAPAQVASPATAPAENVCVAVLEPEVLGDLPAAEAKALAGALDTLLLEGLARSKEFTLVDRQALDKVLAEKLAGAAGLTRLAPAEVAEPLRPFWAAGVIISPTIRVDADPKGKTAQTKVLVEAVLTQTGQAVAELVARGPGGPGAGVPAITEAALTGFWARVREGAWQRPGRPLVEVAPGQLTSPLPRLAWMRDELDEALRQETAATGGVTLLVTRHPLLTKEERLLRAVGLAAAKDGDPAAGLAAAPDATVRIELIEQLANRVGFGKTPLAVRLTWSHGGETVRSEAFEGTVGEDEGLRTRAVKWLGEKLAGLPAARGDDPVLDAAACRRLAAESVVAAEQLLTPDEVLDLGFFGDDPGRNELGTRALAHATRAAHLDPTNRQAARTVAMLVHCAYWAGGRKPLPLAAYDRAIAECQRYLERFKVTAAQDDQVYYRLTWAAARAAELEAGSRDRLLDLTLTPMPNVYRYARVSAQATLEVSLVNARTERGPFGVAHADLWAGALQLRDWVMLNCPMDELDGELAYWRKFWVEGVETLSGGDVPPWEIVLSGYYTRKKDHAALRKTYNDLAAKCPSGDGPAWAPAKVDIHLRLAGDPDWKTWRVEFPKGDPLQYHLRLDQADALFRRLLPQPRQDDEWSYPYPCGRLFFAEDVLGAAPVARRDDRLIEALAVTDGEVWFVTPARDSRPVPGGSRLFVCPLTELAPSAGSRDLRPKPREVPWPERPGLATRPEADEALPTVKCCTVTADGPGGSATLWIGTLNGGLARMERVRGAWQGRWYRGEAGTPVANVYWVAPCRLDGRPQLLLVGTSAVRAPKGPIVWTLDPASGELTILHEDLKNSASDQLIFSWPKGFKLPVAAYDVRLFPKLDLKDATVVTAPCGRMIGLPAEKPGGQPRLWRIDWPDGGEADPRFPLAPAKPTTRPERFDSLFVEPVPGGVNLRLPTRSAASFGGPPAVNPFAMVRRGLAQDGVLWMVDSSGFQLWGYRPAPAGDEGWADRDAWIGPFVVNGGGQFISLLGDGAGQFFASNTEYVDRLDPATLLKVAEQARRLASTRQLTAKLQAAGAAPGWQKQVAGAILDQRFPDALAVIDEQLAGLGAVGEKSPAASKELWVDLMLWQGLAQARAGFLDEAADLYRAVARSGLADGPAKALARLNLISCLHRAQRWQAVLDEADAFGRQFPDLKVTPGPTIGADPLPRQVADAREKAPLASTRPDLQPRDTHAPRRTIRVRPPEAASRPTTRPAGG